MRNEQENGWVIFTSESIRKSGSQSSQQTRLRDEEILNRASASGCHALQDS